MSQSWYFNNQQHRYDNKMCSKYRVVIAEISLLIKICEITLVNLIFILVISLKKKKVPLTFP